MFAVRLESAVQQRGREAVDAHRVFLRKAEEAFRRFIPKHFQQGAAAPVVDFLNERFDLGTPGSLSSSTNSRGAGSGHFARSEQCRVVTIVEQLS
jgi:hypothetical protein